MSAEAKVGAFAIGGIAMLSAALIGIGDIHFGADKNITLYAGFKQVLGLENQADVRLSGVPVGKVERIENDGGGVTVTLKVNQDVKIPDNSTATVLSVGVMGDKFVNITPGKDDGEYLRDGDHINVTEEADMNKMFDGIDKVLAKVENLLQAVEGIVGNETFQKSVVEMSDNMKSASEHMNGLMESLERVSRDNEQNINQMATQLNTILATMNATIANVEHMTANLDKFAGDPQTVADLKNTLTNISATSKNIAGMAENLNKFVGDPQVNEDMRITISNARNLTERADSILEKVQGASEKFSQIEIKPSVDILYSGKNSDWNTNLAVEVAMDDKSLHLGVEDIGDSSRLNAQVGRLLNEDFGVRAGIVAGEIGLGLDAYAGNSWKFSAEAYDLNDIKVRLKSQYRLTDSTYILGEIHAINKDSRAAYFGIKQEF